MSTAVEKASLLFAYSSVSKEKLVPLSPQIAAQFPFERGYLTSPNQRLPKTPVRSEGMVTIVPESNTIESPLITLTRRRDIDPTSEYHSYVRNITSPRSSISIIDRELLQAYKFALSNDLPVIAVTFFREIASGVLIAELLHVQGLSANKALLHIKTMIEHAMIGRN